MKETFFIYAAHYMELRAVQKAAGLLPGGDVRDLAVYLLMPAFCIAISVCAVSILRKWAPGLCRVLTGGRGHS